MSGLAAVGGWVSNLGPVLSVVDWVREKWSKWRERRRKPQLRVYFDAGETYHRRQVADQGMLLGLFCHVMVANDGIRVARACEGQLVALEILDAGGYRPAPGFVSAVRLKWAHEPNFETKDVLPREPVRLDLCYTIDGSPTLTFFAPGTPSGNQTRFGSGTYRARIRVRSTQEDLAAAETWVEIRHRGTWDELKVLPL